MGIFSKKPKTLDIEIQPLEHTHTWKDLPWYMITYYDGPGQTAGYKIVEPYICIECGERKNQILEREDYTHLNMEEREKIYARIRRKYKKYLKPRAVVEDMINNILLVRDPDHLHMVETIRGLPHQGCGTSARMEWPKDERAPSLDNR